jgi:hypothetical protein
MPAAPSPAQSDASRRNGTRSNGPATAAGRARSSLNGVRHGLSGRIFLLLADEDPAEFQKHEALWLAAWSPRDLHEQEAAATAIRCMWRQERADRLEAVVLDDLFAAERIADAAERDAAKASAFKALNTLLRYRARIDREHRHAMAALETLRQRRPVRPTERTRAEPSTSASIPITAIDSMTAAAARRSEPEPGYAPVPAAGVVPSEPEPRIPNRHQRRTLAAIERKALRWAA